jgi:hypothetical protein
MKINVCIRADVRLNIHIRGCSKQNILIDIRIRGYLKVISDPLRMLTTFFFWTDVCTRVIVFEYPIYITRPIFVSSTFPI